jgi:aerobic-type carbon monoxide dehydrogenase small subunit (CoxS/CutS family)
VQVAVRVNGHDVVREVEPQELLLDFLRDRLALTGAKRSCDVQVCGACTVLVDGVPVRSCLMLGVQANGAEVRTVEGVAQNGKLHPLQEAFLKADALQCGFCTSGMIMAAAGLLSKNPKPSREEIVKHMDANVCRCGTYARIVNAIEIASGAAKEVKR